MSAVPAGPPAANHSLTAVPGIMVGHWTDPAAATGCTVVLTPQGAVGGVDVRGGAPGTRETDVLDLANTVQQVHAVLLTGGSAFGLDAATGVMRWLEERGSGFDMVGTRVPVVCAAVLFDLTVGRADVRPDAAAGYAACEAASAQAVPLGTVGAGTGATVGKALGWQQATKSGIGSAVLRLASGVTVGALAAVNAGGDVIDPAGGTVLAGARSPAGGFLRTTDSLLASAAGPEGSPAAAVGAGGNTTLAVVATDAVLSKPQASRLAMMAQDGLARCIDPCHTPFDGDTVFALATGVSGLSPDPAALGAAAARATTDAVLAAVRSATGLAGIPSLGDLGTASAEGPSGTGPRH